MKSKQDFKYDDDYTEYLRHYYAGLAMASFFGGEFIGQSGQPDGMIAERSVSVADALIAELNKDLTNYQ